MTLIILEGEEETTLVVEGDDVEPTIVIDSPAEPPTILLNIDEGQGPQGPPGPGAGYTHVQTTPSATWVVVHDLNSFRLPMVILDGEASGDFGIPDTTFIDEGTLTITFDSAVTGKAYL